MCITSIYQELVRLAAPSATARVIGAELNLYGLAAMPDFYPFARPLLWRLPPEIAHKFALRVLRMGLGALVSRKEARKPDPPALGQTLWGLDFRNPIGVAAGFDKDGFVPDELLALGFGFVEIGTITPRPQAGNPKPRLFRLDKDAAIINSMGFPSAGLDKVLSRLEKRQAGHGVIGINIGKNRDTEEAVSDYAEGIRRAAPIADYLVINVSSPNTPGLRELQRRVPLQALIEQLLAVRQETGARPPLLVKIAPDLEPEERADIAAVALATADRCRWDCQCRGCVSQNPRWRKLGPASYGIDFCGNEFCRGLEERPFKIASSGRVYEY